jgi:hypothetical protein
MKTIYIEPDEEIISVIDRLGQAKNDQVNLVMPANAQIWQSSINLKLLKREADNLGKEVTLVVSDDLGAETAEKIGFRVKREKELPVELIREEKEKQLIAEEDEKLTEDNENMIDLLVEEIDSDKESNPVIFSSAKKRVASDSKIPDLTDHRLDVPNKKMVDIVSPRGESRAGFFRRGFLKKKSPGGPEPVRFRKKLDTESTSEFIEPAIKREKPEMYGEVPSNFAKKRIWPKFFVAFIVLVFLVAGLAVYLILPNARVVIFPKREKIDFELLITGVKGMSQIDENLNKIPIEEIEVRRTKSKSFLATGEKEISEKAKGIITIYNEYSSEPQTLVATTRFESPEGKIFRINKTVTVPGAKVVESKIVASTIDVEVTADQPGEDYNIGPTDFTIPGFKGSPKFAGFYGKSKSPMSGGMIGTVKVVSEEDLERAEKSLTEELKEEINRVFEEQLPDDLKVVEGGIKEEMVVLSDIEPGVQLDEFELEMRATLSAALYKEKQLQELIDLNLISKISEDKIPLSDTQEIIWQDSVVDWGDKEVSLSLRVLEEVAYKIDIETIRQDLLGQSEVEVRKYLVSRPDIEKAKITFWPFWVKRMPVQEKKVEIIIEEKNE